MTSEIPKWYTTIGAKYNQLLIDLSRRLYLGGGYRGDATYDKIYARLQKLLSQQGKQGMTLGEHSAFERWIHKTHAWVSHPDANNLSLVPKCLSEAIKKKTICFKRAVREVQGDHDPSMYWSLPFLSQVRKTEAQRA